MGWEGERERKRNREGGMEGRRKEGERRDVERKNKINT